MVWFATAEDLGLIQMIPDVLVAVKVETIELFNVEPQIFFIQVLNRHWIFPLGPSRFKRY
ncbi:MAG: hypothetical protein EBT83_07675 [Betaproteobacteria bacterium]|nr:hypothetical protein [Betaproteobacteria bacterium]